MAAESSRYKAEHRIGPTATIETWLGTDQTLGRPVTVRVVQPDDEVFPRMRSQVRALARIEHPGLLHVLDTCPAGSAFAVITEPLPTGRLSDELADTGRLEPERAVDVVRQVGAALHQLHTNGFAHGGPTPEQIGVRNDRSVVLLDGPPTSDAVAIPATPSGDLLAVGQLLHRLIAGAPALTDVDGVRETHPDIPPALRGPIERAIAAEPAERWPDVAAFVQSLPPELDTTTQEPDERSFLRAERAWFAPVAIVGAIAVLLVAITTFLRTTDVGRELVTNAKEAVGIDAGGPPTSISPTTLPVITDRPLPLDVISLTDFDPTGNDRSENPDRIVFINDDDPTIGWQTERYSTAQFGNLKPGVGLIVEVGPPQLLDEIVVRSPSLGWSVEVFSSVQPPSDVEDWGEPIGTLTDISGAATVDLDGSEGSTLLIWITDLGDELSAGGHRVVITEVAVHGRPIRG